MPDALFSPAMQQYLEQFCEAEPELLYRLRRETYLKVASPTMISGPQQGRWLAFLSKLLRPQQVLEIGTFTGYAALCLAEGLAEGGQVHTIERNDERQHLIEKYIEQAQMSAKIKLYIGAALEIIPQIPATFDLVFIDADKENYGQYFDLCLDKVRPGGLLLADNVLWKSKVVLPAASHDKLTRTLHQFNEKVRQDSRVEVFLLPLRDGLMMMRKC
ncbi:MAG: O-methyltransferase [Microscillaceae bacterium]